MSVENGMEWKKGICGICPAGCWIEAGMKDGKLIDIKADEDHQLGRVEELRRARDRAGRRAFSLPRPGVR